MRTGSFVGRAGERRVEVAGKGGRPRTVPIEPELDAVVERYLDILRTKKVSVDNIVAITFTNRAANEMRQRVRERIDALLRATSASERSNTRSPALSCTTRSRAAMHSGVEYSGCA